MPTATPNPAHPAAPTAPGSADTSALPYCDVVAALSDYGATYAHAPQRGPRGRHRIATCTLRFHHGPLAGAQIGGITVYATAPDGPGPLHSWRAQMPAQVRTLTSTRITLTVLGPQPGRGPEVLEPLTRQALRATQDAVAQHQTAADR